MVFQIAGNGAVGMMRAIPDIVDDGALGGEFGAHPVVQHVEFLLGEVAARDAGLVGEEEHVIAGLVEPADRLRRVRHPADPFAGAHIAVVVVDDPVAVEKGGGLEDRTHCGAASCSTRWAMSATWVAAMSRMQR